MITYGFVLCCLIKFTNAPWWLYIPTVTMMVIHLIDYLLKIYAAGKESGSDKLV